MAIPDIRCTIYNPAKTSVYSLDASGDVGKSQFKYSDSPDGSNAAATIPLALRYEDVEARGYWTEWNIVEVSSGDNVLVRNASLLPGGSSQKYYLDTVWGFDTRLWMDDQVAYFWDQVNLTQRCPVSGIGFDNAPTIVNQASAHGSGTSLTVPISAATAGNTLLIIASVAASAVGVSGTSYVASAQNGSVLLAAFSKVAAGGETSITINGSSSGPITATVLEIANAGTIAGVGDSTQTGALLWTPPIVSPGAGALALAAFSTGTGAGSSTPRGWTPVVSQTTTSTTLTQAVTASASLQTITVASGSSFAANEPATVGAGADQETVTLTAVGTTSIQAVFSKNHVSGETVTAAVAVSNALAVFEAPLTDTSSIATAVGFNGTPSTAVGGASLAITIGVPAGLTPAPWILVGTSLNGGGTPAYLAGQTIVGRRRYSGVVQRRVRPNSKTPNATITCTGMAEYFNRAVGNFAFSQAQNVDIGIAIFSVLNLFATQWPFFTIDQHNFPTLGQTYDGTFTASQVSSGLSSMLKAIASGDGWFIRVGHDFTPRLIPLYRDSNNSYVANVTLQQGTPPQAVSVSVTDSDVTAMYNRILVTGDTDATSGVAVSAEVVDNDSFAFYGLYFDGAPVQVQGLKTTAECANYGRSLLDQNSLAKSSQVLTIYTRYNPGAGVTLPGNMLCGDVIPPAGHITATGFVPTSLGVTPADIDGLVSVVATTIECDATRATDSYQTANFSAMLPDWKAELAEKANAIANALATNSAAAAGIDQYFVDASAYPPTIFGFTVTLPMFEAVFAQGSTPIQVGGISYTVAPNTTSRAWLLPNNTIEVVTDGSIVAGAIPYLFQQSNSSGITGTIQTAQVGLLQIPASYLIEGNLYTPTVSGPGGTGSPIITPSATGQFVTQLTIEVEVTDQPTDGSLIKTILYYRQVGQPTWLQFATSPPRNSIAGSDGQGAQLTSGATSSTGLYIWIYPEAANGTDFEFGLAQESNRGTETAVISLGTIIVPQPMINPVTTVAGTGNINLVPDGQLAHVVSASNEAYWSEYGIDGVLFGVNLSPDVNTPYNCFFWKNGAGANRYANSPGFQLNAGVTYNLSFYSDLINATGTMTLKLIFVTGTVSNVNPTNSATVTASVSQSGGRAGNVNTSFTPSATATYCVQISNSGVSIGPSKIFAGAFQVTQGATFTGFIPSTPVTQSGTTAHAAASVGVQTAIDATGNILPTATASQSSFLNSQGSIAPYTTDFQLVTSSPSGATYVKYYICGAGGSGTAVTFYRADGTNFTVPAVGSSAAPIQVNNVTNGTAVANGNNVYFIVYVPSGGSAFTVLTYTPSAPTPVQVAAAIGDGTLATIATATTYSLAGGGGGLGGGGGCPELSQRMWMRVNGVEKYCEARHLVPGNSVMGSDGRWKELHKAIITPGEIWRVTFDTEIIKVDASHLFMDPKGAWINVKELAPGQELQSHGRDRIKTHTVKRVGMGEFMAISIDHPFAYQIGRTISHNLKVK